jgi:hypothetical protein
MCRQTAGFIVIVAEAHDQKRIFAITGDQLKLTAPLGATVGTAEVTWKRVQ